MQIILLNGGLANQAFQYMFGMRLQQEFGEVVTFDDSYFDSIDKVRPHSNNANSQRRLLKKIFDINVLELSSFFDIEVWNSMLNSCFKNKISMINLINTQKKFLMIAETADYNFDGDLIEFSAVSSNLKQCINSDVYWHGYWIQKDNFELINFKNIFNFKEIQEKNNLEYMAGIMQDYSVGVHIRRFSLEGFPWDIPSDWYVQAVTELKIKFPELLFYIFSDDLVWCKGNILSLGFTGSDNIIFVEGNEHEDLNFRDLQLMTACKHLVISNSSFSYLAALLNNRQGVIINPTNRRV
jgi:hypothetical protein